MYIKNTEFEGEILCYREESFFTAKHAKITKVSQRVLGVFSFVDFVVKDLV